MKSSASCLEAVASCVSVTVVSLLPYSASPYSESRFCFCQAFRAAPALLQVWLLTQASTRLQRCFWCFRGGMRPLGMRPTSLPGRPRGSHHGLLSISKLDSAGWLRVYIFFSELGQSRERGALVTGWHDRWREGAGGGVSSVNLEY